ncbi:hypothetical protein WSK_3842 [Novosphingobium sp. Rr 2-17]|uniref:TonB-dependent receptor n=1 Tax=Novosphingobium sp. Rr 2-17 TaxID=555793 RepID=UPI0002698C10|nr:TonB-dependent receptor [Novosphingobium sp. Rr 2-17]EIZ77606.1 hypothetical protein WSK_3842 [Novosphingobium sp. Rr 2-17]
MKKLPASIALCVSVSAFGLSSPAYAGDVPGATGPDNGGDHVEDIVVTAQRRKESLQNVPVAVSAVSGATAKAIGITDVSSIQTIAPSLEFPRYFNSATPALRGVGTNSAIGAQESVVALYIDDVYIASPAATTFSLNNIDQIAVLKGPQGTLFGRNAMAGVIQITTRDPSQKPTLDVSAGYGNFGTVSGSLYGATGITDNLAADIAVAGSRQKDGWGKNIATGEDAFKESYWAIRSKWVWEPSDTTKITAAVDYTRNIYNAGIAMRPTKGAVFPNGQTYEGYYNINEQPQGKADTKQGGASLKIEQDLGFAELTSITSWRKVKSHSIADEDQSVAYSQDYDYNDDRESWTEEVHIASPKSASKLTWIAGLFYLNDKPHADFLVRGTSIAPLPSILQVGDWHNQSYAAFGQATYAFLDSWHLTGGLRYTRDTTRFSGLETVPELALTLDSGNQTAHFSKLTYKAALQKNFSDDVMAYVSYSTGYKSGIFNFSDFHAPAVKPENLSALEGGLKTELFDKHLRLNITGFYYWYKNLQVSTLVQSEGRTLTSLQNAAAAHNKGIELEVEARPVSHLTIRGAMTLMHSRFTSFPDATLSVPLEGGGNATVAGNASGFKTPHSPDFTSNIGVQYDWPTDIGDFSAAANYNYNGGFVWDADNRLKQNPYHLINASLNWQSLSGGLGVQIWVKNLLSQKYAIYATANIVGDEESPAAPRTFGITLSAHI